MKILLIVVVFAVTSCGLARSGALIHAREQYAKGKYQLALNDANEALTYGDPAAEQYAEIYLLKAKCLEKLNETDEAAALYLFIIRQHPHSPQAYQASGRLAKLEPRERRGGT